MRYTNLNKIVLLGALAFSNPSKAFFNTNNMQTGMQIKLGQAWDPLFPKRNRMINACFFAPQEKTSMPILKENIIEGFIESKSELNHLTKIHLDADANFKLGAGRADIAASYDRKRLNYEKSRTIRWTISGYRVYEAENIESIAMTAKGEEYFQRALDLDNQDKKKWERFFQTCGRSLVTSVQKESRMSVVYEFQVSDSKYIDEIKSEIVGTYKSLAGKGGLNVNLIDRLTKKDSHLKYSTRIVQVGFSDKVNALHDIVKEKPGDLAAVRSAIHAAIKQLDYPNAQVVKFHDISIKDNYGLFEVNDRLNLKRHIDRNVERIEAELNKVELRMANLDYILSMAYENNLQINSNSEDEIHQEYQSLFEMASNMYQDIETCQLSNDFQSCRLPKRFKSKNYTQWLNGGYIDFSHWQVESSAGYTGHNGERIRGRAYFYPVLSFQNMMFIDNVKLYVDGKLIQTFIYNDLLKMRGDAGKMRYFFKPSHGFDLYCWAGEWGNCDSRAANPVWRYERIRDYEQSKKYELVVEDLDGNTTTVSLGNVVTSPREL